MESRFRQIKLRLYDKLNDLVFIGMAVAIPMMLLIFVLYPVLKVGIASIYSGNEFTFNFYQQLSESRNLKIISNTGWVTLLSTALATLLGLLLAFGVVRTNCPGKGIIHFAAILHIISPPFVSAIVFILLFGRRGFITNTLLGLDVTLIGWQAVVFLQTIGNASIAYLIIANILRRIDQNIEKCALDLGASKSRVFFTVTLPLLLPGISAALLLVFTNVLADFGTPILVGGGFRVLASEAYLQVISQYNMGLAATLSMLLLVPCLTIVFLEKHLLGNKLFTSSRLSYSKDLLDKDLSFHPLVSGLVMLVSFTFALFTFSKFSVIALGAVTNIWGYDYAFSLRHIEAVWNQGTASVKNSLKFAVQVAIFGPLLGICTAYYLSKIKYKIWQRLLDFMAILPYAIPGPVVGISYIMAFHNPPLVLTGTGLIVVLVCIFRELPISYKSGKAVLYQVAANLEQAALDLGSSKGAAFTKIILPIMAPAYKVGMLHAFIHTMITIGAIIFLVTPRNKVITFEIFTAANSGKLGEAAAFSMMLIVLTLVGLGFISLFWKLPGIWKRLMERLERP